MIKGRRLSANSPLSCEPAAVLSAGEPGLEDGIYVFAVEDLAVKKLCRQGVEYFFVLGEEIAGLVLGFRNDPLDLLVDQLESPLGIGFALGEIAAEENL